MNKASIFAFIMLLIISPKVDALEISNEKQLKEFAELVNNGDKFADKTIKLTNDIILTEDWVPIGITSSNYFAGTFDGQGKTISGLNVSNNKHAGLFGVVGNGVIIKDVSVFAVKIEVLDDNNSTDLSAGVLVGEGLGSLSIIDCHASGKVSIPSFVASKSNAYLGGLAGKVNGDLSVENSGYAGDISALDQTSNQTISYQGGLVGKTKGIAIIKNSYANGNISATKNSGKSYLGGLAGIADGNLTIEKSYSGVNILSGYSGSMGGLVGETDGEIATIKNSYASGKVYGSSSGTFVGGLIGSDRADELKIENSYVSGEISCGYCTMMADYYYMGIYGGGLGALVGLIWEAELQAKSVYYNISHLSGAAQAVGFNVAYEENYDDGEHGIFGVSGDELKNKDTFDGWDFANIWGIDDGKSYPCLCPDVYTPIRSLPQLANQISVQTAGKTIMLGNLPSDAKIEMYNLQGKRIYSANSGNSQFLRIPAKTKGVYLINVNGKTFKVVLRDK